MGHGSFGLVDGDWLGQSTQKSSVGWPKPQRGITIIKGMLQVGCLVGGMMGCMMGSPSKHWFGKLEWVIPGIHYPINQPQTAQQHLILFSIIPPVCHMARIRQPSYDIIIQLVSQLVRSSRFSHQSMDALTLAKIAATSGTGQAFPAAAPTSLGEIPKAVARSLTSPEMPCNRSISFRATKINDKALQTRITY